MNRDEKLQRLYEDRDMAERDLEILGNEERQMWRDFGDDYEQREEWEELHREMNELENSISYMNACIESIEEGYEE